MLIYKIKTLFDPETGQSIHTKVFKEERCDFSGEIIDFYDQMYCCYDLNYLNKDPCFGSSDDEFKFGQEYSVDMFNFLNNTYYFIQDTYNDYYAEKEMMKLYPDLCFHEMCRISRIKTAIQLIENKIITPGQLEM